MHRQASLTVIRRCYDGIGGRDLGHVVTVLPIRKRKKCVHGGSRHGRGYAWIGAAACRRVPESVDQDIREGFNIQNLHCFPL